MKFRITTTCNSLDVDKMLKDYPVLRRFGFSIKEVSFQVKTWTRDENGKSIRQMEERSRLAAFIFLDSLEQLTELMKAVGEEIVVSPADTDRYGVEYELEIYDGYRE